jgi:transaldolase/glucose-6-phosphate isomerase
MEGLRNGSAVTRLHGMSYALPAHLSSAVAAALEDWRAGAKTRRLWARDASLWTGADEGDWLGWLKVVDAQLAGRERLRRVADESRSSRFSRAVVLGMGGSSLCPDVMSRTFGAIDGHPELHVLDSTDPAQIKALERELDLSSTLFIVSSKSGTTLEPNILTRYFFERVEGAVGRGAAGSRFVAITDPGSSLQHVAEEDRFRAIFFGVPSIGGRYSALSDFGMVPAAIMGVDVVRFLERAAEMVQACSEVVPVEDNPGVVLGAILGVLAGHGLDKVTLIVSPEIAGLGAWLEQLLAESTGKQGKGLIPVDLEPIGPPRAYGHDRLFVYVRSVSAPDPSQDAAVDALEGAGHPMVRIALADRYDLAKEFFRWEIATAVAGSIIGINPFDQPDVDASKMATRTLTAEYERSGSLPVERPILQEAPLRVYADQGNAAALLRSAGEDRSLAACLRAHLDRLGAGDYFALLAYLQMSGDHENRLQAIRRAVRDRKGVATCLGFGPRFLHSTGQLHKGGRNRGVFLQITCQDAVDLPVPGQRYTFGVVKAAQAQGDLQVLAERERRALRVDLGVNVQAGLAALQAAVERALS